MVTKTDGRMLNIGNGVSLDNSQRLQGDVVILKEALIVNTSTGTIVFNDLPTTGYEAFELFVEGYQPPSSNATLAMSISNDNGATWYAGTTHVNMGIGRDGAGNASSFNTATNAFTIIPNLQVAGAAWSSTCSLIIPRKQIGRFKMTGTSLGTVSTGTVMVGMINWFFLNNDAFVGEPNAFRINPANGGALPVGMHVQLIGKPTRKG